MISRTKFMSSLVAIGCGLAALPAQASEVSTFRNQYGWSVGDTSTTIYNQGLQLTMRVNESYSNSRIYPVVQFCNNSSSNWRGSARVSSSYPDDTLFAISLAPGACYKWGEHMESTTNIYIIVDRDS